MRVLVIGGSGFIGRRVVAQLAARGVEVAALTRGAAPAGAAHHIAGDRKQLPAYRGAIAAFAPEVVIDMIPSSRAQAEALIEAVRGVARRTVVISSMDVYRACGVLHGLEPGPLEPTPLTESAPLRAMAQTYPPAQIAALQHLFGWLDDGYDKLAVERAVATLEPTVLRLPLVYGPGDALHRLQPLARRILDGRRGILFGATIAAWRATRGYVDDVAHAIALAATSAAAAGRTYNVGEPDAPTELEWAHRIAALLGWDGQFMVVPDEQLPPHLRHPGNFAQSWVLDTRRIRDELGFIETIDRDRALTATLAYERATASETSPHAFDYTAEDTAMATR